LLDGGIGVKEVSLIVPNRIGVLAEVTEVLGNNGINITSISAQGLEEHEIIRLITSDEKSAVHALTKYIKGKGSGYELRLGDVIMVTIPDKPGELSKIIKRISRLGINIDGVYQIRQYAGKVDMVIKPEKMEETVTELKKQGVKVKV